MCAQEIDRLRASARSSGRGGGSLPTSAAKSSVLTLEVLRVRTGDGDARNNHAQRSLFSVRGKPSLACPGDLRAVADTCTQTRGLIVAQAVPVWYPGSGLGTFSGCAPCG